MAAAGQQLSTDHQGKDVLEDQQQALATGMRASNTSFSRRQAGQTADDSARHVQQQSAAKARKRS